MALRAQMNERQMIEACQAGDRAAFRQLFETHKDRVYSVARHFCADQAAAQDVAQEVFVKLFRTIGQYRHQAAFSTWLHRIVVNTCLSSKRKTKRTVSLSGLEPEPNVEREASQERLYQRSQLRRVVSAAVSELGENLRMTLILRYMEELSYSEIAETLGCSIGTVASRLNRAHKILGKRLAAYKQALR